MRISKIKVTTKEDIEQYYSHCRKIRFADEYKPESLKEVFEIINTPDISATFHSRGASHCEKYRARSIDDYIKASKFYFPDKTVKEIVQGMIDTFDIPNETWRKLKNIEADHNTGYYNIRFCPTIRKDNFYLSSWRGNKIDVLCKTFHSSGFPNCHIKISDFIA